jgi:transcriptional regulator with XRE-family HTH domain
MTYGGRTARVREWRKAQYLSQRQLAEKTDISREIINNAEAGKPMRVSTVQKLVAAFGIEPADLFRLPEETREESK